jgi:membrane protease YdiL (CAAX protease family)
MQQAHLVQEGIEEVNSNVLMEVFMKQFIKAYWKTLLFFAIAGIIGGFFTGIFVLDSYPPEMQQQLLTELSASGLDQFSPDLLVGVITAMQAMGYGIVLGAAGIWLGKKTGLWKDENKITKKALIASIIVAAISGMALILCDILFFGKYSEMIMESYNTKPTISFLLASVIYGGVIEEVMLRLFWMSFVTFILWKIFGRMNEHPSSAVLITANLIAALLFAAGHLPATATTLGLSPMIIFRCFLLNGGIGLLLGWLYRKYGLRYAMIAHGGCHIVSKLIWILFI